MAEMMNMNADTMLCTMTPFGTNDDCEMICDENGIWCEFEGHQNWTKDTKNCAVEAFLDTFSEAISCMEKGEEAPERM